MTAGSLTSGERRAALALHALTEADRRWLLQKLPADERERVTPLLAELDALGLQIESDDVAALTAAGDTPPPAADWRARLPAEPQWVVDTLDGRGDARITPAARAALRDAAQRQLHDAPALAPRAAAASAPRPRWRDGFRAWFR